VTAFLGTSDAAGDSDTLPAAMSENPAGRSVPALRSRLLTFLIADIRGYTRFTQERGDEAATRLVGTFARVVRETVAPYHGELIELRGDEILVAFDSAREALRAATELQARCTQETDADPSLPLRVGAGLDAGEAVAFEGGYRSGALNLAARLCSLAQPGDVLASAGVLHLARKVDGLAAVSRGEVTLKGLEAPVHVYQIGPEDDMPPVLAPIQPVQADSSNAGRRKAASTVGIVGASISLCTTLLAFVWSGAFHSSLSAAIFALALCGVAFAGAMAVRAAPIVGALLLLGAAIAIVLTLSWDAIFGVPLFLVAAGMAMFSRG
jgi:class 3 adenylate cyclase